MAFICCLALAYVSLQVGDRALAGVVLALAGAMRDSFVLISFGAFFVLSHLYAYVFIVRFRVPRRLQR